MDIKLLAKDIDKQVESIKDKFCFHSSRSLTDMAQELDTIQSDTRWIIKEIEGIEMLLLPSNTTLELL